MKWWLPVALMLASGAYAPGERPAASPELPDAVDTRQHVIEFQRSIGTDVIQRYSGSRTFWTKLVDWIAGPGEKEFLARPFAICEDNTGRLLISDPDRGRVHVIDFERRKYDALLGSDTERFLSPMGLAVDADDNIYVSDADLGRIFVFDRRGRYRFAIGSEGNATDLQRPTGMALDAEAGRLYVTDAWAHKVQEFDLKGKLVGSIGRRGTGPAEFNYPTDVTLGPEGLYVLDSMNFRVQVLSREGEVRAIVGRRGNRTGEMFRPKGIAVDSEGHIYVVDALFEIVQIFDLEGELLYYFGGGGDDQEPLNMPGGIYIAPRDVIYVADSLNSRVRVYRHRLRGN